MKRMVAFCHKASISYYKVIHRKTKIRLAFLFFYEKPLQTSKPLIYMVFIFVELEINVWITIHRCRAVADY